MSGNKSEFASANLTVGQVNAIVKKLGGYDGAMQFLKGGATVLRNVNRWRLENGNITFSIDSNGTAGTSWVDRLECKGFMLEERTKEVLASPAFSHNKGTPAKISVLRGIDFGTRARVEKQIHMKAREIGLGVPSTEIACFLRENVTDDDLREMGLCQIVVMHEPIEVADAKFLLSVGRNTVGQSLSAVYGWPGSEFLRGAGFAFMSPEG